MNERYVCVHGHFYQPPRENPWLERVELQESAYPYHDWNERITAECYSPNTTSRILDDDGLVAGIVNNYARMSFNFGPTLFSWLEDHAPDVYAAILEADRESLERFDGHGAAMAQPYNHVIMPLARQQDKVTQVRWGLRDFEYRFGRQPEGMWLPETAVDLETLDVLADHGILFTLLAPHQVVRTRAIGGRKWSHASSETLDTTMPYRVALPSGRSIAVFFYDGPVSRGVAFEGLLNNGERFAERLAASRTERDGAQIVQIATDGESYGHHHRHGDMALARAIHRIEKGADLALTTFGRFLADHPPTHEAEIVEPSSWSCSHGVERWQSDCGCRTGGNASWSQAWRRPLRDALDWLRDELVGVYEKHAAGLLLDPWRARDAYIDVILDRSTESVERFLSSYAVELDARRRRRALELLELQRHAMLMYTSCGWFFDDVSRIETLQILRYAGRAIQLAGSVAGVELETGFLNRLAWAHSNVPEHSDGKRLYETDVKPSMLSLESVAAHYSVRSLFEEYQERDRIHCYTVERKRLMRAEAGRAQLVVGRVEVTSEITGESRCLTFAVLHFGDHTLTGGVRAVEEDEEYEVMASEVNAAFDRAELTVVVRLIDHYFGENTYSLGSLFRDEQHRILGQILESRRVSVEAVYEQLYAQNAALMRFLSHRGLPTPRSIHMAGELVLNTMLRAAFEREDLDLEEIHELLDEARETSIQLEKEGLGYALQQTLERLAERATGQLENAGQMQSLIDALAMARELPFEVDLTKVQNLAFDIVRQTHAELSDKATGGDERAAEQATRLEALAACLEISLS